MSELKKHIAVLAFPFGTHAAPLLSLVRRLSVVVPDARFSFFSTAESNGKLFSADDDQGSGIINPYDVIDGLPENYRFSGDPQEPVEYFLNAATENFKHAMEMVVKETGRKCSCIISDAFLWFAADLAEDLHVPWVSLWTAGPRALLVHMETDEIRRIMGFEGSADRTIDFLPGFSSIRVSDLPGGIVSEDIKSAFARMLHKMGLTLPRAAAVASNSFRELDSEVVNLLRSRLQNFLNVGPFVITPPVTKIHDPHCCLDWLDKQKQDSVAYISFGSVITPPPDELAALAEGLEESGFSFLWSFRGISEEKLPKGFLERTKERGRIVSWTPQVEVLKHNATGVFMTHCGWNSVGDAIVGGTPMICRPFFGDQLLNTRTVEAEWGIGLGIEGGKIAKDGIVKSLRLVLATELGKRLKQRVVALQKLAMDATEANGSSTMNFKTLVGIVTN